MIAKVSVPGVQTTSLANMPTGYGEIKRSWSSGVPDMFHVGRVLHKRVSDGKVFWVDDKEVVVPDELREAEIVMLPKGSVITLTLDQEQGGMGF
jgi:hypothetical protein